MNGPHGGVLDTPWYDRKGVKMNGPHGGVLDSPGTTGRALK